MTVPAARVGIVVRTKNRPWFLARALRDIAAQSFASWQVCVVDDGGEAGVVEAQVAALAPAVRARVHVHRHEETRGRSAAANAGVRALATEFVILHDDDDLWDPDFLARASAHLDAHPDDIGVVGHTEIVYEQEVAARPGTYAESGRAPFFADLTDVLLSDMLVMNRFVPISYLYRRVLHDEIGFYREDIHAAEDWEFNLRTLVDHRIGVLPGPPLAFWMQRVGVGGEAGNSMFALADDHRRYDALIRDEALREWVRHNGLGLPLHLARAVPEAAHRGVDRALDARPTTLQRVWRVLRRR